MSYNPVRFCIITQALREANCCNGGTNPGILSEDIYYFTNTAHTKLMRIIPHTMIVVGEIPLAAT